MQRNRTNTTTTFSTRRFRAGFTLLEVIVALIVITTMLSVGAVWLSRYNDRVANELVAGQMRRLGDALKHYVDDNAAELSKGSTPAHVPWAKVKPYLPPGLDQNTVNPLGQTYDGRIRVVDLPNGSKRVDALIYTNGAVDIAKHSMKIARLLGAGGFYFDWNRVKGETGNKLTYWNASGQVDDPSSLDSFWFGGHLTQSDLSLIMYVPFLGEATSSDPDQDDLLHRKAVAGKPELNRMETNIDMNSNGLDNVGGIAFKGGNREVTGVKRIQFEKSSNADPVSVAISNYGWFTVGDPSGKRTNLWANEIEADGNLKVHANSTVEGSSTVKGSQSVGGSLDVKGGIEAKDTIHTTEFVEADRTIKTSGDLWMASNTQKLGGGCLGIGRINVNADGDLMVCKNKKWSAVADPQFTHDYVGSHWHVSPDLGGNSTDYSYAAAERDERFSNRSSQEIIRNKLDRPAFMTVTTDGDTVNSNVRCYLLIYKAASNGAVDDNADPIAMDLRGLKQRKGSRANIFRSGEICSVSFIAQPGATYKAVYEYNGTMRVAYTY